jgi:uncharacterized RDD family membrane protein YckC
LRYELWVEGRPVELAEGETTVGRSRSCALALKDPAISRSHARLALRHGRVTVVDLASSNGTFLNGSRLQAEAQVLDGDRLVLGETEIQLRIRSPAEAPREAAAADPAGVPPPVRSRSGGAAKETPAPVAGGEAARDREPRLPTPRPRAPAPPQSRTQARFLPAAGFWIRLVAWTLDTLWMNAVGVAVVYAAGGPAVERALLFGGAAVSALALLVPVVGWARWGTTPGKRLLRLYVSTVDGQVGVGAGRAVLRWVGYLLSGALFGLGFAMIGVSAAKRGLHDLVAGTYVGRR